MASSSALNYLKQLFDRYFSDPQIIILLLVMIGVSSILIVFGAILAPVLAAIVLAYLLDGLVDLLTDRKMHRKVSVLIVYFIFIIGMAFTLFALLPLLYQQSMTFVRNLPAWVQTIGEFLRTLPEEYPALVTQAFIEDSLAAIDEQARNLARTAPLFFVSYVPFLLTMIIYCILVPLLVFFMLWDKEKILIWLKRFLPRERSLLSRVWAETNVQIANYIRGKFWEILIVGGVSWIAFTLLGLNYAVLLAVATGLSVLVPYVGATVVTLPIAIIAYIQWGGFGSEFWTVMAVYFVIQALDANVLVPILFSRVNNLHPVAIIVAIAFFGGLGGVLGVLFAIPLATLIKAVLSSWPTIPQDDPPMEPPSEPAATG